MLTQNKLECFVITSFLRLLGTNILSHFASQSATKKKSFYNIYSRRSRRMTTATGHWRSTRGRCLSWLTFCCFGRILPNGEASTFHPRTTRTSSCGRRCWRRCWSTSLLHRRRPTPKLTTSTLSTSRCRFYETSFFFSLMLSKVFIDTTSFCWNSVGQISWLKVNCTQPLTDPCSHSLYWC